MKKKSKKQRMKSPALFKPNISAGIVKDNKKTIRNQSKIGFDYNSIKDTIEMDKWATQFLNSKKMQNKYGNPKKKNKM